MGGVVAVGVDELLAAWERGTGASATGRALHLAGVVRPGATYDDLAGLTLGERDLALLELRTSVFGDHVDAFGQCPACGADLDVAFDVPALLAGLADGPTEGGDGRGLPVRPPTSADVMAVLAETTDEDAAQRLLLRCLAGVPGDEPTPVDLDRSGEEVVRADPASRLELLLVCEACDHQWSDVLDVAGFVWTEVAAWARRTLGEVHLLARAYGWREADVLALSPLRRATYLQLVDP